MVVKLIEKSFTELSVLQLDISIVKKQDYFMAVDTWAILSKGVLRIEIDKSCNKMNQKAITGCLAHELSHAIIDLNKSKSKYILGGIVQSLFDPIKTKDEREADLLTLKRGYAENLIAFLKFQKKYYEKYNETDGLTIKEIKEYINS